MEQVKIGWAKKEFSLDKPVAILGQMYVRVSEGIADPLYATALCVDGGEGQATVIFCSLDEGGVPADVMNGVREQVAQLRPQLPLDAIIFNATHTHTAMPIRQTPNTTTDGRELYPWEECLKYVIEQTAAAIVEAWDTRAPGGMGYGYGYAVVAHSRRSVYLEDMGANDPSGIAPNGHAIMYGKTNHPLFSGYENGADHFLNRMFTFDANSKLTGIVVNVPCPSQVSEVDTFLSADYWCEVRQMVAAEFGDDVFVLPQCAPAGDTSPRILHYHVAQERRMELKYGLSYAVKNVTLDDWRKRNKGERMDIADRIVTGIKDVYSWAKKDIHTQVVVGHIGKEIQLERRKVTAAEAEYCRDNLEQLKDYWAAAEEMEGEKKRKELSRLKSIENRNKHAIERYEEKLDEEPFPMDLHVVRIGDIAFATNRFEYYTDFMHRIQARSPFVQTFAVQLAGGTGGTGSYLPVERAQLNKGYGSSMFCNTVGYQGGQQIVEHTLELLQELKGE